MVAKDTYHLLKILSMHNGCKAADPNKIDDDDDEELSDNAKLNVYNEIRLIVMQMYIEVTEQHLLEL